MVRLSGCGGEMRCAADPAELEGTWAMAVSGMPSVAAAAAPPTISRRRVVGSANAMSASFMVNLLWSSNRCDEPQRRWVHRAEVHADPHHREAPPGSHTYGALARAHG